VKRDTLLELLAAAAGVVRWAEELRMYSEPGTVLVPCLHRLRDATIKAAREEMDDDPKS
jgi:hypothetical protein